MLKKLSRIISIATMVGMSAYANADDNAVKQALSCYQISQCTYFNDFYHQDKAFQEQIARAFQQANIALPDWVSHSTSVPMIPVLINSQSFLIGLGGEQHNMPHQMAVLYSPDAKIITIRYVDPQSKVHFIGDLDGIYVSVLKQYVDPTTALSQIVTSDYATLPVILNPYLR